MSRLREEQRDAMRLRNWGRIGRRIAVLAALNLAHELSQTRRTDDRDQREIATTLGDLSRKMDRLLAVAGR